MTILRLFNTINIPLTADTTEYFADNGIFHADSSSIEIQGVNTFLIYPRFKERHYDVEFYNILKDETSTIDGLAFKAPRGLQRIEIDTNTLDLELNAKYVVTVRSKEGVMAWQGKVFVTDKTDEELQEFKNYEEDENNIIKI